MTGIMNPKRSVLQDWVMELPLREQGTLLTCVRGCDSVPKLPYASNARVLVGALRYSFMVPADRREVDAAPGCFMVSALPSAWKASEFGHYPQHWVAHVMHGCEVVGFRHPNAVTRTDFFNAYLRFVHTFHLTPESFDQYVARMSEDRIATGEVVS